MKPYHWRPGYRCASCEHSEMLHVPSTEPSPALREMSRHQAAAVEALHAAMPQLREEDRRRSCKGSGDTCRCSRPREQVVAERWGTEWSEPAVLELRFLLMDDTGVPLIGLVPFLEIEVWMNGERCGRALRGPGGPGVRRPFIRRATDHDLGLYVVELDGLSEGTATVQIDAPGARTITEAEVVPIRRTAIAALTDDELFDRFVALEWELNELLVPPGEVERERIGAPPEDDQDRQANIKAINIGLWIELLDLEMQARAAGRGLFVAPTTIPSAGVPSSR